MKSGTTSIHHHLSAHPGVFIPEPELFFFDSDDVVQHPQLLRRGFALPDYREDLPWRIDRYRAWFEPAAEGQLLGEDTTTYLASERAPARIAELLPEVRLIFVLRDPVDRAYSHYWHLVRHGQAFFDFDATLEHMTGTIVQRGLYKAHLERYFELFPREQVRVVIFEEFRSSPQRVLDDLCAFLGLMPYSRLSPGGGTRHNAGTAIRHPLLYRGANALLGGFFGRSRASQTPAEPASTRGGKRRTEGWVRSRLVHPVVFDANASYPPIDPDARARLARFYDRENAGLGKLLNRDLATLWPVPEG